MTIEQCINDCAQCFRECVKTMNHCLDLKGKHAGRSHIQTLNDCAKICKTAESFMLEESVFHRKICALCSEICDSCARSCRELDAKDSQMSKCAKICDRCAHSCREVAKETVNP